MDLTPYLPYLPIVGAVLAALGLAFNVRNARKQREKAQEEQPRRVYVRVKLLEDGRRQASTIFLRNGSDYPIYRIDLHWTEAESKRWIRASYPMLEPDSGFEARDVKVLPESRVYAAFYDHNGNQWKISDSGFFRKVHSG